MMSYLKEFLTQINHRDFHKFLVLWEEYCTSDTIDTEEFSQLLKAIKSSEMAKHFGQIVETALPLWRIIEDQNDSYEILKLLIDIQTTNSPVLAEVTFNALQKQYGNDPKFNERIKLAGLRNRDQFQGALSKYDLVAHLAKGNIVFHTGGWGTGEIVDISFVREHLMIEFENVSGRKDLSFANAFKTLIPLPPTHFLAKRFTDPDRLEKEGREDPIKLIRLLLHDMGPKTAAEIKDELCELVIAENDWTKWWQGVRSKLKKDPLIQSPDSLKEPFYLRKAELTHEDRFENAIRNKTDANEIILTTYSLVRDHPTALKNEKTKESLFEKLSNLLEIPELSSAQRLQIYFIFEQYFARKDVEQQIVDAILQQQLLDQLIDNIEILAFKKRALVAVKDHHPNWIREFLNLLFALPQAQLRDYILKELNQPTTRTQLEGKLKDLLEHPVRYPEMFMWYFQKLVNNGKEEIPFQTNEGKNQFFESFLILYSALESRPEYRDLLKKMYNFLSAKRYAVVRELLQGTSLDFAKEFLLLVSKCQSLTDHDIKILCSLAEVVHPSLASPKQKKGMSSLDDEIIWTTEQGYLRTQDRIKHIGTVEVVENAREIEAARALGDLRENSEFKFAQEKRGRLQSELKLLSDQLKHARVITPDDIHPNEIGIGNSVEIIDSLGNKSAYCILGPWDANPEQNILSLNSKFVQAMLGKKIGEMFSFREESYKVLKIGSFFDQDK